MSRIRRAPWMTLAWVAMGALVTGGFYSEARDDQARCEAGNELRRVTLPAAFRAHNVFLGGELRGTPAQIDEADARFQLVLDDLFPERDCPLF